MDRIVEDRASRLTGRLADLKRAYDASVAAPRAQQCAKGEEFFVFRVNETALAIRSHELLEALRTSGWVRVPGSPPELFGAMSHRQEVLQLIDLHRVLGLATAPSQVPEWTLVLRPLVCRTGLLADGVLGLRRVADGAIEPRTEDPITGQFVLAGQPVTILGAERLSTQHRQTGPVAPKETI